MIHGHGDDFQGELIANFSSNVWWGADHSALYHHLIQAIPSTVRYPETDAASLQIEIAKYNAVKPSQTLVCNGSTEAFYLIANTHNECTSVITSPTFSEYADACRMYKHQLHFCSREKLSKTITTLKPMLVWLCNPNNPDGYTSPIAILKELLTNHPESTFVIDQAYADFTLEECLLAHEVNRYPNLILVQSLTKRYAIPGLRLGYIVSSEQQLSKIEAYRIPWSVNTLAIEAGKLILNNCNDHFPITEWLDATKALQQKINKLDFFECIESSTPYFLIKLKLGKAADLKDFLLEYKILVRNANNFEGLDGEYIRVCTLRTEQNDLLIDKLIKWTQSITR